MKKIKFEKETLEKVIIDDCEEIMSIISCYGYDNYAALFKKFRGRFKGIFWFKGKRKSQDNNSWEYVKVEQYLFFDEEGEMYSKKFKVV